MTDISNQNKRYLVKYYYIATPKYYGSQIQPSLETIEGEIVKALREKKYIKNSEEAKLEFASRTDKFVSARGACFSFCTNKPPIPMEINTALPKEIGVWAYAEVPEDYLSRYNAEHRHYKYIVYTSSVKGDQTTDYDFDLMKQACAELQGDHDFINFSKREEDDKKTIRTMDSVEISIEEDFIIFDFISRAFLRQQIRRMVRKILELGQGIINYDDFLELFNPILEISYQPADPNGLILWDIKYGKEIQLIKDIKSINRMKKYFFTQKISYGIKYQLFNILEQDDLS